MSAIDPDHESASTERDQAGAAEGEEGLDLEALKDHLGFLGRACQRRPRLAAGVFAVVAALGLTIAVIMPRSYRAEVRLGAERDYLTHELSNPNAQMQREREADNPTRNVGNVVRRRDNLVALVRQANLVEHWHATRSPPLKLKDWLLSFGSGPRKVEDEEVALAETLDKRLTVWNEDDSSVTIAVDWDDPKMAYQLTTLVQKNFVEARYDTNIARIQDAIKLLEDHANSEAEQVDAALEGYLAAEAAAEANPREAPAPAAAAAAAAPAPGPGPGPARASASPVAPAQGAPPAAPDPDVLKALEDKRREIRQKEDDRQHELEKLKQALAEAQLTLTPLHPKVIGLQQAVAALGKPAPELAELTAEERALMAQIAPTASATGSGTAPLTVPRTATPTGGNGTAAKAAGGGLRIDLAPRENPALAPSRSKLESAIHRYQEVTTRLDTARLELDITRTAFQSAFSVIAPAEVPKRPKKPIPTLVGVASVLAGGLLGLLGAASADWRAGRLLETWQVRRRLKIEVLGELEQPPS